MLKAFSNKLMAEETVLTKIDDLNLFIEKADEFINAKYILADVKLASVLKSIASSETLVALFKNCLTDFNYETAKKKYLVKSPYLSEEKGEFILPSNTKELLAFIFNVLVDIDAKNIDLNEFVNKYFYIDGSFSSAYEAFLTSMIKPFKNSVKILIEKVIDGSIQDPLDAIVEEEHRRIREKEEEERVKERERELLQKTYGKSVKRVKDLLLIDKQKIRQKIKNEIVKDEILLIVDMLGNVITSEDKDAIQYAFVAYKYLAKTHRILFFGRIKKLSKLVKEISDAI